MKCLWLLACTAIVCFIGNPRAHCQAEIDPDHYDTVDSQSLPANSAAVAQTARLHYQGNVTLHHAVQCEGKTLSPGAYLVSLDSDGWTAQVTLNRKDQVVRIEGIPKKPARHRVQDSLVIERNGTMRQLSAIQTSQLDLVLRLPQKRGPTPGDGDRSIERLPVMLANAK